MKLYAVGQKFGMFPDQKSDDALAPFRGEAVYFNQKTGTDSVYQVRSGRRLRRLYWKGAAMQEMTIEILDVAGNVLAKGGPWGGGNTWAEFTLDFPPTSRFTIRMRNPCHRVVPGGHREAGVSLVLVDRSLPWTSRLL